VLTKTERLREKLETETDQNRRKQLIRHIELLLDEEDNRLSTLIHETLIRIENLLYEWDARYEEANTTL
jgi:hypothetical protein